jgi:toluene monooxygenase system ferredoxin subunit
MAEETKPRIASLGACRMVFVKVCNVDDLGPDGIAARYIMEEGVEVLVARDKAGCLHAINGTCPHEDYPLVEGWFDGTTVTCAAHGWVIDVTTGQGVNPASCSVDSYPVRIEGGEVWADLS